MTILNFSHPLTPDHLDAIARLTGQAAEKVIDLKTHFDSARPFAEQAREVVDSAGLSPQEWQGLPLLVNPPSLSVIACLVLAELHGRMGYFPPTLRLRALAGSVPPRFEVAEVLDLHAVREAARAKR